MGFSETGLPTDVALTPQLKALAKEVGLNTNLITGDGKLPPSEGTPERQLLTGFLGLFARTPATPYFDTQEQTTSLDEIAERKLPWVVGQRRIDGITYRFEVHSQRGRLDHALVSTYHDFPRRTEGDKRIIIVFPSSQLHMPKEGQADPGQTRAALRTSLAFFGEVRQALSMSPQTPTRIPSGGRRQ
ncbi:MAG: hypothetical protein KGJ07_00430 [Patescibacteria group bacterium]|nr:hypothetical protein [Patescibacteria group bacterium]